MSNSVLLQLLLFLAAVLIFVKPLGWYIARVYSGQRCGLNLFIEPIIRFIQRCCGIDPAQEMDWKQYLFALLLFNFVGLLSVYALQRLQYYLPFNPQAMVGVPPDLAFNTAASLLLTQTGKHILVRLA